MSKDWFIYNAGKSVVPGGMYEREDAEKVAQNAARRHPGRTYTVMQRVAAYQFPTNKDRSNSKA